MSGNPKAYATQCNTVAAVIHEKSRKENVERNPEYIVINALQSPAQR